MASTQLRKLLAYGLIILAGCAKTDERIDPEQISLIEYSWYFGFAGFTTKLSVTPTTSTLSYSPKYEPACTKPVSSADWQALIRGIDWNSYRKEKSEKTGECCDRSATTIMVTTGRVIHQVERYFIPKDSSALGKLAIRLSQRLSDQMAVCR